jgi:hypothetical protein
MAVGKVASRFRAPATTTQPQAPSPLTQQYNLYNQAVKTQAGDYDRIMDQYRNLASGPAMQGYQNLLGQMQSGGQAQYAPTADVTAALGNLGELSRTGGYSEADKSNIRERGISPIRSVYANAQRDINRQRALQGGYSPSYGALTARMAGDMSGQISDKVTDVNAQLAQAVAQNRLSAASPYASAAGAESGLKHQVEMFNKRDLPQYQLQALQGMQGLQGDALRGQASLYGTTPALSNLFGNQALQGAQLQNQITQQNRQQGINTIGQLGRVFG